ncbi:MAG TPA: hypothetical protein VLA66_11745 [Thermoanaerobaculia bacterium]|nr:hypothetical protein [Thermoanaerobaculia bacterium]
MRRILLLAPLVASIALVARTAPADEPSTGQTETRVVETTASTGAVETAVVPVAPREPIRFELGTESRRLIEGRTSAASSATVTGATPVGSMVNARLSSPENQARIAVFQPGSETAEPGTLPEDGAIAWIGTQAREGELRFVVHTASEIEIPFRIQLEVTAPEPAPE